MLLLIRPVLLWDDPSRSPPPIGGYPVDQFFCLSECPCSYIQKAFLLQLADLLGRAEPFRSSFIQTVQQFLGLSCIVNVFCIDPQFF